MTKQNTFLFLFAFLFFQISNGQTGTIQLENPSFEATPQAGNILKGFSMVGWKDCGPTGETPPDIHPEKMGGPFGVILEAREGQTYLGMVVRDNNTWESIGQRLNAPLLAGKEYAFNIQLARSLNYRSVSRKTQKEENYATPCLLRIWGGNSIGERGELLDESLPVENTGWETYRFRLFPNQDYAFILFEAYFKISLSTPYNGNLLLDNASDIVPVDEINASDLEERAAKAELLAEANTTKLHAFSEEIDGEKIELQLFIKGEEAANKMAEETFERGREIASTFRSDLKQLYEQAGQNGMVELGEDTWKILSFAKEAYRLTKKNLDVTSGGLRQMWQEAAADQKPPSSKAIEDYWNNIKHSDFEVTKSRLARIRDSKIQLDVDDLLRGYILDEMAVKLQESGFNSFRIQSGQIMLCRNEGGDIQQWAYERPLYFEGNFKTEKMGLQRTNITTVGSEPPLFESNGKPYFDLINSETGMAVSKKEIITLEADGCMKAVALARALASNYNIDLHLRFKKSGAHIWYSEP